MPEPISSSSSSSSQPLSGGAELDPTLDQAGQICRSDAPNRSQPAQVASEPPPTPPAVAKLLSAAPPPVSHLPPPTAQNNAQRTSERPAICVERFAEYGLTGGSRDAVYAGVAALKGRDPTTGLEVEVFSASGQIGGENELQAGMARVGVSGKNGNATAEVFTARAAGGAHNEDGSVGINSSAIATIVGLEGTLVHGVQSFTLGVSAGAGYGGSIGLRDSDDNLLPELCFKASIGPVTVGACLELEP
jgi:hypothetical protein